MKNLAMIAAIVLPTFASAETIVPVGQIDKISVSPQSILVQNHQQLEWELGLNCNLPVDKQSEVSVSFGNQVTPIGILESNAIRVDQLLVVKVDGDTYRCSVENIKNV